MKLKKLLFLFCLFSTIGHAQIQFQTSIIGDNSNYGTSASGAYAADLDGDNDLDLLAYYYEGNFVWFENKPNDGGLVEPKIIHNSINGSNANVFAIDIDNDGDLDPVGSSGYDIFWYENDGLGNFTMQHIITTDVESVNSIDYYDIDGDGDLDILSTSIYDDKIAWYENENGLGSFGAQQIISDSNSVFIGIVFAEDMDGDGDGDVVVNNNGIKWYENSDGNGTFTTEHNIASTTTAKFLPVDLDQDGDMDIVVPDGYDDDVIWFENINGLGTFSTDLFIGSVLGDVDLVAVDDLDGDGDLDVLADGTGLFLFENEGNEDFGFRENIYSTTSNAGVSQFILTTDFDDDGDVDVFSDGFINYTSGIMLNEYDQTLSEFKHEHILAEYTSNPIETLSADVDNDNDLDIVVLSTGDNKISWFEDVDGTQNFVEHHIISTQIYRGKSLRAEDIDADGDVDIFVVLEIEDKIVLFKNQGNGNFDNEITITTDTNNPKMIQLVDLDNDGDLDLLSASSVDDKLAWYENTDGIGSFGAQQVISTEFNSAHAIYAADFDNDGDLDLLASGGDGQIGWVEHTDGQGSFGPKQTFVYGAYNAISMDVGDIDGDGFLDFVVGSGNSSDLQWYRNEEGNSHPNGQFGYGNDIRTSSSAVVSLNDVDNDGALDVIITVGDDILWYTNQDGLGDFVSGGHVADIRYDKYFFATDMDFDGDVDVVSTKKGNDQIAFSKNLGVLGNEINGTIQVDINGNGCDEQDAFYPNIMVVASNGSTSFGTFTMPNGSYQIPVNTGNFETSIAGGLPSYLTSNPASYYFNYSNLGNIETADFCLEPNQAIPDVNISIYPLLQARPGFEVSYRIVYKNVGTETLSGTIDFQYDNDMLNVLSASETISNQTANALTFNYSDLMSYETRYIDVDFNVLPPPTVNIDDVIFLEAIINPVSGDFTEEDNVFSYNQLVIGSYDPNDITCLEGDEVLIDDSDKYLHYLIRFQNTGTASAINIRVENVLDDKLDWNTLQIETISHMNRVEIKDGNELSFIFSGINLPDSTSDEPNSHGFIAYKIKPKSDVIEGDIVHNTADIYFDFNEAIVTNTATTEFVGALSIEEFTSSRFTVYPNPTTDEINIQSKLPVIKIEIYNNLGQQILGQEYVEKVDLSQVRKGIYFMTIHDSNGNQETLKIIKK
ncbi:T9SS type A sorting domain-containing protein [Hanstruepera flava]|uniref:T9SS type A sorting domain-containing protein n=1 Tax=Hanstruepera flava TaxID=2930218 RepID=UPI002027850B|nr:T9SS type A sorting domain-containing protein [Hanstruepera flava]